jgi:uncharacterized protein (DUF2062 family)
MFWKQRLSSIFHKALHDGWTAQQLAKTVAIGAYIAMSPFPGAHTIIMIVSMWLLRLNFPLLFITASINNPWTMVPLYSLDYFFGYWLIHHFFGYSPMWNISLQKVFGSGSICVWSFIIGGNVLGIIAAGISYPLFYFIFSRFLITNHKEA